MNQPVRKRPVHERIRREVHRGIARLTGRGVAFAAPAPTSAASGPQDAIGKLYERHPPLRRVERFTRGRLKNRRSILKVAPKQSTGAEIGVYTGQYTELILRIIDPKTFYAVDPWHTAHGSHFSFGERYSDHGRLSTEIALEAVEARLADRPGAEAIVSQAVPWLESKPENFLDWAYLDASHRYEATLEELHALARAVRDDGVIMGDDGWPRRSSPHYGVFRAVRDFCKSEPYEIVRLDHFGQWAIRKTDDAAV